MTKSSATLIDHVYCSHKSIISLSGVANINLSDHHLTFCELSGARSVNAKKFTLYRRIIRVDKEQFKKDFLALPWCIFDSSDDIDDAVNIFKKLFCDLWDTHAPLKKRLVRSSQRKHWLNCELLASYQQRDVLYKRFRQDGSSAAWMAYRQARNRCIAATRTAKRAFFLAGNDKPRLFWSKIKECTGLGKLQQASLFWPCSTPMLSKASANMINRSFSDRITSLKQQQHLKNTAASSSASMVDVKATASRALNLKKSRPVKCAVFSLICHLQGLQVLTLYLPAC